MNESFMKKKSAYFVPFSRIPYGSNVVIYGGGKLGENYYRKMKLSNRVKVVAIIDAQAKNLPKIYENTPLYEPDKICGLDFDYVFLAAGDSKTAGDMKRLLNDCEVTDDKIIWDENQIYIDEKAAHEIIKCFERNVENKNRRFFLFMLPEHGNLGDYVIGYAELAFFKQYFDQYNVYGITTSEWLTASEFFLNVITPNDIIFINGGGYLGDLRGDAEIYMHVIESFPRNIKIFLPNTLTYQERPCKENKAFMKDIEWFGKQENLFVFFRECSSYDLFHQYERRSWLFLDMALYLSFERKVFHKKNKVLLCLRSDCERVFNKKDKLKNHLECAGITYDFYDIYMERYISQQAGEKLLQYTIQLFQSYDCVITDRLHGMILSVISNVPCIAFDNRTRKISGVFESIKELQYVELITEKELDNINERIDILYENKLKAEPYKAPKVKFEKMAKKIYEIIDGEISGENDGNCS